VQLVITQELPVTVMASIIALIGCELGLLTVTASKSSHGVARLGWICLAILGIGAGGVCSPQVTAMISVSYFGSNCQVAGRAIAEGVGVGVLTALAAVAVLVLVRSRLAGAIAAGSILAAGTVATHAVLLTGLVDPAVSLRATTLTWSGVIACAVGVAALLLRTSRFPIGRGLAAVPLAAATIVAQRLDMSAAIVRDATLPNQLTLAQIHQLPAGIECDRLLVPLVLVTCLSAIGLCFVGLQFGFADEASQPS
jgi:hypothetical protein